MSKTFISILVVSFVLVLDVRAQLPHLEKNGEVTQLIVDGKPFIILGGELHNSTASSIEYMSPIWDRLAQRHLNTVIGTVSWELVEPEEGTYDFSLVDAQIAAARKGGMRLVLVWFASWKNADSKYVPAWVKTNLERFPRIQTREGRNTTVLTPLGEESMAADARAFRALMAHIRKVDPQHTVIMMQVENEAGLLGDSRDRSPLAERAWSQPVPDELMNYLVRHRTDLLPELQEVWGRNGFKTSGTWAEVFGTDAFADEVFMAWHIGQYAGAVAEAGKAELNLPMYVNAWLGPQPGQPDPGQYPSGGPVARVMDIWRAAAPSIDLLAPDIYVEDFKGACALYTRSGNPLFIPETRFSVGNLFWAIGQHAALGFSPFGIDNLEKEDQLVEGYEKLGAMMPVLTEYQSAGKVRGVLLEKDSVQTLSLGGYSLTVRALPRVMWLFFTHPESGPPLPENTSDSPPPVSPFGPQEPDLRPYGLIISTGPDEFLLVGTRFMVNFAADSPGLKNVGVLSLEEGQYENGQWIPGRRLNGDEANVPAVPVNQIGMLKVKLYRFD